MTTKAIQDISLTEKLLDAAINGHEVHVPEGLYYCHFEAVMASRGPGNSHCIGKGEGTIYFQYNNKFGKLIWK